MNILTEIHRSPGVNINGRTIHRTAVRGVILHGRDLLMIYSAKVGDYKFPGGGVSAGETLAQALCREVREECGMIVTQVGSEIGVIVEYDFPSESDYDAFKMTSHYSLCDVEGEFGVQSLDDYEEDLGFRPVWIDIDDVISLNKTLLPYAKTIEWLRREIFALEYIQHNILPNT